MLIDLFVFVLFCFVFFIVGYILYELSNKFFFWCIDIITEEYKINKKKTDSYFFDSFFKSMDIHSLAYFTFSKRFAWKISELQKKKARLDFFQHQYARMIKMYVSFYVANNEKVMYEYIDHELFRNIDALPILDKETINDYQNIKSHLIYE